MPTRLNGNRVLLKLLAASSAVMTECSNRVYGPPLGIPPGMTAPGKAIVFGNDGGPGNPDIPMASERFTMYCYGADQPEAISVFRTVFDLLQPSDRRKAPLTVAYDTGVNVRVEHVSLEMGPADLPDPGNGWPRVVCAWRMVYTEAAI